MALVGSYGSGATIDSTMECLLWGAIEDKGPVRNAWGPIAGATPAPLSRRKGDPRRREIIGLSGGWLRQARSRRS